MIIYNSSTASFSDKKLFKIYSDIKEECVVIEITKEMTKISVENDNRNVKPVKCCDDIVMATTRGQSHAAFHESFHDSETVVKSSLSN